ncbi:MAG: hypothetical protein GX751_09045 [Desulfuromonadaceae bacterium]|nr:hypothetical protein [Desulfuromonadaceae bacterium]
MYKRLALLLLGLLACASLALAADWSQFEKRLDDWQGAREVSLSGGIDPLADTGLSPLIDLLLEKGYALLPGDAAAGDGLILERHSVGGQDMVLLKRTRDGALLARRRLTVPAAPVVPAARTPSAPAAAMTPLAATVPAASTRGKAEPARNLLEPRPLVGNEAGLLPLADQPRRLAVWPAAAADGFDLFLLYDDSLRQFHYDGRQMKETARFPSPAKVSRALYLKAADGDGDGRPELAVVWAEDVIGVYQGTDSHLHAFMARPDGGSLVAASDNLKGYLAYSQGHWWLQQRGGHKLFLDQAARLEMKNGRFAAGKAQPVDRWLYDHADWPPPSQRVAWNADGRLFLQNRQGAGAAPLLLDFGRYEGPPVFVPLESPQYRSGFSRQDQILSKRLPLPRRLVPAGGALYSLIRGRSPGLPLVGNPTGRDRLVRIRVAGDGLQADEPYGGVEAFIQDFDLLGEGAAPRAVLLLNEKEDGRGAAYLALQEPQ